MSFIQFLQSVPAFKQLTNEDLSILEKSMLVQDYLGGHKFIEEGKSVDNVYLIVVGEVAVTHKRKRGVLPLNRLHSGDLFGLVALIDHGKRSATCTADGPVTAASLPRSAFELLHTANIPLANRFQRIIAQQLLRDIRALTGAIRNVMINGEGVDVPPSLQAMLKQY